MHPLQSVVLGPDIVQRISCWQYVMNGLLQALQRSVRLIDWLSVRGMNETLTVLTPRKSERIVDNSMVFVDLYPMIML